MKFIGDDDGVGKELFDEGFVGVAQVCRDVADVFSAWDVIECCCHFGDTAAFDEFHEAFSFEVNDHGDELAKSLFSPEIVLIDADDFGPGIQTGPSPAFEFVVEVLVQKASGALKILQDGFEGGVGFAGPEQSFSVSLGEAFSFADAGNGLGERLLTAAAPESSFADFENDLAVADRRISDTDPSSVVDSVCRLRTFGTHLHIRGFFAEKVGRAAPRGGGFKQAQLGKKQDLG